VNRPTRSLRVVDLDRPRLSNPSDRAGRSAARRMAEPACRRVAEPAWRRWTSGSGFAVGTGPTRSGPAGISGRSEPRTGFPTHPIAPGGQPPGIWGGAPPYVDIGGPGSQPRPSHPIAPGGQPPGFWGGIAPPVVGYPLPPTDGDGDKPPVIWPGTPSFPIVLPPEPPTEGETPPNYILIWAPGWAGSGIRASRPRRNNCPRPSRLDHRTTPKPPTATPKV
jgi:hypothetical protein